MALPPALLEGLALGIACFAAGLFAVSAAQKVRTFLVFSGFLAGYRLVPPALVRAASSLVVLLEALAVPGVLLALPVLAYLPFVLLLVYALAMSINLLRGRRDIDCGCGGAPMPLAPALVARNVVLALAFGWAAHYPAGMRPLTELDASGIVTALGFAACAGVLYAAVNQLQANRAIHRRLWISAT